MGAIPQANQQLLCIWLPKHLLDCREEYWVLVEMNLEKSKQLLGE